ncbi:MAG: efflux RND transporter permease subunit [Gammaproteobacteria bacterium]|nr:efflux RND transporter permease subunit [Gammaproteobacteria bacterium]
MAQDASAQNAVETHAPLGLAGKTAQAFIHSPLSPLLFLAMMAMGIIGLMVTPRQEDPQISVPIVDLFVAYPGASSEQVAALAIEPLERIMSEIPGVKHVYSASQRGQGVVTVRFIVGEEAGTSLVKVHDKLQSNMDQMPPGVSPPLVKAKGIDDVPVVTVTLWSDVVDGGGLRRLSLNLLQSLKQIPDTGQGFVVGGRSEQIQVDVLPERLAGFGVSLEQVAQVIRASNSEAKTGSMESNNHHMSLYVGGFLASASDVGNLLVSTYQGQPVYIKDVATVTRALQEPNQLVTYSTGVAYQQATDNNHQANNAQAVTVAIAKKMGANGVMVADAILAKVESLKGRLIPAEVHVEVTRNYGASAADKVNELLFKLVIATGIVTLLVWYALGMRPAIVVTLVIPVVILMTVFAAFLMGFSIDRVSLFALIFSIGILVDDAIVVVENVYRRWLMKGEMDTDTAVDAIREVGNPTIVATFAVVAALLPMAFVSGLMGPYMGPIPALGSVAMIISLFAAFAFTAWLIMRIKPSLSQLREMEDKEHAEQERLDSLYRRVLVPLIENRFYGKVFLIGLVLSFFLVCSMFYTTAVTVKMLPYDNKQEFSVVLDMPEGSAMASTANAVLQMAEVIRLVPEVTAVQTYTGTAKPFDFNGMVRHYYLRSEPWQGELQVQLLHKTERDRSSHEIAQEVRGLLLPIVQAAGGRLTVAEMPPGPPVVQSVVAEIYGPDAQTRRQVAADMTKMFEGLDGLADVDNLMQQTHQVWHFEVDTQKASRLGISVKSIIRNLSMAMGEYRVDDVKQGAALEPTYIVLQIPLSMRSRTEYLNELPIASSDGKLIPLAELGRFVQVTQDPVIYHKDLRPLEYVVGDAVGRLAAPIYPMSDIDTLLENYTTPDGVTMSGFMTGAPEDNGESAFEWGGEWTITYVTFRDMGIAFGVALILIYMLVVGMIGNFVLPAVIMAPIPLTLLGIVPGHWIMGAEFTATSMIGFIALAGIIVRNSILLVDFSIAEVKMGTPVEEAVLRACKARTRPIVITALALMGGASVILSDPIFQGMAVSLLFGVMISTILTLIVIPLGCISVGSSMSDDSTEKQNHV